MHVGLVSDVLLVERLSGSDIDTDRRAQDRDALLVENLSGSGSDWWAHDRNALLLQRLSGSKIGATDWERLGRNEQASERDE